MIQSIRHMVEMESPSRHKKSVDLLGERLAQAFREIGGEVQFHRGGKFGAHLQVDFASDYKRPPVLLLGHFDTVWDLGTLATMPFRESDGRLWGPGVLDMKSGIAQMIFAIESLGRVRWQITKTRHRASGDRRRSRQREFAAHYRINREEVRRRAGGRTLLRIGRRAEDGAQRCRRLHAQGERPRRACRTRFRKGCQRHSRTLPSVGRDRQVHGSETGHHRERRRDPRRHSHQRHRRRGRSRVRFAHRRRQSGQDDGSQIPRAAALRFALQLEISRRDQPAAVGAH